MMTADSVRFDPQSSRTSVKVLYAVLGLYLFFLPNARAIDNVCIGFMLWALVGLWVRRGVRVDAYVAAWMAYFCAALLSALMNYPFLNFYKGLIDTLWCTVGAILVYSLPFPDKRRTDGLFFAMMCGSVVACLWGFSRFVQNPDVIARLELPAGGSVTQSSIFVGIALIACIRLRINLEALFGPRLSARKVRVTVFFASLVLLFTLIIMSARGSALGTLVGLGVVFMFTRKFLTPMHWAFAATAAMVTIALLAVVPQNWLASANLVGKITSQLQARRLDSNDGLRVVSQLYGWHLYAKSGQPLWGVGPRNFAQTQPNQMPIEITRQLPAQHVPEHAHNFVLTKLAEEGIVGVAALAWILGIVALRLWRDRTNTVLVTDWAWPLGVAAWVVPVVSCSFNAPWFQEHAQFAAAGFSLYFVRRKVLLAGDASRA